jgi:putative membrane protein
MTRLLTSVLSVLFLTGAVWASEPALEGPWDMYPTWWPVGVVATALLLLVLFGWALLHLVPLALAILASVLGIRWLKGVTGARRSDSAVAILRERYARGEIGKEEFAAKMRDLGSAS